MPIIDFDAIPDADDFSPLPNGTYLCILDQVVEATTKDGKNELWKLEWVVISGEYADRKIFDNMVFSEKAMPRVKLICSRLGINTTGQVNLMPDELRGKTARVLVTIEEYTNDKGETRKRNSVPFAGYERINDNDAPEVEGKGFGDDEVPF